MRDRASYEVLGRIVEAVHILPHHSGEENRVVALELAERRVRFEHEQRVGRRQAVDEWHVERRVVGGRVARATGAAIALEGFPEENVGAGAQPLGHQPGDHARILSARREPLVRRERSLDLRDLFRSIALSAARGHQHCTRQRRTQNQQFAFEEHARLPWQLECR
jgi:hypothetical protein